MGGSPPSPGDGHPLEGFVVGVRLEDRQPGVGPMKDVLDVAPDGGAPRSAHGGNHHMAGPERHAKVPDTNGT